MTDIAVEECWLRWRRGEAIEVLAKEYGVTRERMRYRLNKLNLTHPSRLRDVVLEEAAKVAEYRVGSPEWSADTNSVYEFAAREIAANIRALKNQNPDSTGGEND